MVITESYDTPLQSVVLAEVYAFLEARKTGQIVLHIKEGRVLQVDTNAVKKIRGENIDVPR